MKKPLCALTMGDPSGIGPEVALKTLCSKRALDVARMVVVGFSEPFIRDARLLGMDLNIHEIDSPSGIVQEKKTLNLIVPDKTFKVPLYCGVVYKQCGRAAALCIERSAELAIAGEVDAVVTAPINKESLHAAGYKYPGHTEFFQHLTGADDIAMMLTLDDFRVTHVVTHTAIRDVPDMIRKERIIRVAALMDDALKMLGINSPRLVVSGLNPHAGEAGMFGNEELKEIIPAVVELKRQGRDVTGPLPPDTVFARAYYGEFDGVVAMYHDQGHIALKLAGFKFGGDTHEVAGVNITLGLPIIRTSVDHGTAFDIAGKGLASPLSMVEAVEMASAMAKGKRSEKLSGG